MKLINVFWIVGFSSTINATHEITKKTADINEVGTKLNPWSSDYINFIGVFQNYYNHLTSLPSILSSSKSSNIQNENDSKEINIRQLTIPRSLDNSSKLFMDKFITSHSQSCDHEDFLHCQVRFPYRSYDGSCNNLDNPAWGMARIRYTRLLPSIYSDGVWEPALALSGNQLPPARLLSYRLFPPLRVRDPEYTLLAMQYGQIITHDMSQSSFPSHFNLEVSPCCDQNGQLTRENLKNPECYPMIIGNGDPVYDRQIIQCLEFNRTVTDKHVKSCRLAATGDGGKPAEQISIVTQYLDLSLVYGSSETDAMKLRTLSGGRLRTQIENRREWLPPKFILNSSTIFCNEERAEQACFAAGDDRVNQNPQLTIIQTLFARNHNRIATILSRTNPHWSDETIYQETRRITIAQHQFISYYEWLPIIIGLQNAVKYKLIYDMSNIGYIDDYNKNINPGIMNEHANGAFRVFHSSIAGYLKMITEKQYPSSKGALRLSDWLLKPSIIQKDDNIDDLTRGFTNQHQMAQDEFYDREITEFLFRGRNRLGSDLRATDIQRSRDHGLATYNDYREFCGLPRARNWVDFDDYISQNNIEKLSQLYEQPDDVDFIVGGSLEVHSTGSLTGPTFLCILIEQFYRSRVGDRFWFETPNHIAAFTQEQLNEIRKSSIARLLCDNSDNVHAMQYRAFEKPSAHNPIVNCEDLPSVNLSYWKDYSPQLPNKQRGVSVLYKKK